EVGCITNDVFRAVDTASLSLRVPEGMTVAGIEGKAQTTTALPACETDGQTGCITTETYRAVDTASLAPKVAPGQTVAGITGTFAPDYPDPANVYSIDTVGGVPGTLNACSSDGADNCVATATFPAANIAAISSADIRQGVTIAGIGGSLANAPPPCSSDGDTACLIDDGTNFRAAA